jgi:hypothetical protein
MRHLDTIAHTVRRLQATGTTDELVHYVERAVGESFTRGYAAGYRRREDATLRTLLWRVVRRSVKRAFRRLVRRIL